MQAISRLLLVSLLGLWGEGGRGQNGGKSEENCLELAKMDWNEGKGQVKEGPAEPMSVKFSGCGRRIRWWYLV